MRDGQSASQVVLNLGKDLLHSVVRHRLSSCWWSSDGPRARLEFVRRSMPPAATNNHTEELGTKSMCAGYKFYNPYSTICNLYFQQPAVLTPSLHHVPEMFVLKNQPQKVA